MREITFNDIPEALAAIIDRLDAMEGKIQALVATPVDELIDVHQAAELLKRSPQTLYQYVSAGKIPHIKNEGRLLFSRRDLERWVISNQKSQ